MGFYFLMIINFSIANVILSFVYHSFKSCLVKRLASRRKGDRLII